MSVTQLVATLPLAKAPDSWPFVVTAGISMLALAALDFAGAIAAKQWSDTGSPRWLAAGVASFVLLFYVYASSLRYADLAMVTMGWIVLLQVGLLVLDHARYGVTLAPSKWVAVVLILVLQTYLVIGPSSPRSGTV
jgi:hypothetical protein